MVKVYGLPFYLLLRFQLQGVCTFVAAVLQYMYTVVLCLLLAEAIELMVAVLLKFDTKPRINTLAVLSWRKYNLTSLDNFVYVTQLTASHWKSENIEVMCTSWILFSFNLEFYTSDLFFFSSTNCCCRCVPRWNSCHWIRQQQVVRKQSIYFYIIVIQAYHGHNFLPSFNTRTKVYSDTIVVIYVDSSTTSTSNNFELIYIISLSFHIN